MTVDRRFSVAPMLAWTDSACRQFHRLLSKQALLYTEMVTTGALLHGDVQRHLQFQAAESPVALQLGGSVPEDLARSVEIASAYDYAEINLNVGCPSNRVQAGAFGACLMAEPELVGRCVAAMQSVSSQPVTVKCRVGIDRQDRYDLFLDFIDRVCAIAVPAAFIVHARKAWLDGLSPKDNRNIPPLRYDFVHRLKRERPQLLVVINGGFTTEQGLDPRFVDTLDGAMVGRDAYQNPYSLCRIDAESTPSRVEIAHQLYAMAVERQRQGLRLWPLLRHCLGLFNGVPGAKQWRRTLSEEANAADADASLVLKAIDLVIRLEKTS